ncbi:calcium homeostasis modulator protein 6-like [Onychostruthus taczanowskii]|uniref:calcium homeostasis modulator protein 6-like n=1 Tax=Onychostruthus taczanowskii TaxID=356909 RepID=UPI001B80C678|nr:calcium homeostasis modulator protein 6-like [Onychostruthus taczanowskii]
MQSLQKVMDFCILHQTTLSCSLVSLLTAGSEYIFSSVVFKCPCNSGNMLYGYSFLLAPAFVLLLLGFMTSTRTWLLLTGTCSLEKHPQCCSGRSWASFFQVLVPMTVKASVAPLTWIAVALLGANFYECAATGSNMTAHLFCKNNTIYNQEQLYKMPCDKELAAEMSDACLSFQAQSQLIGWFLIGSIITVALISTCVTYCYSPVSYLQFNFWKMYSKKERELFEIKANEHANKLAERNTNCFFEATDPAPFYTPRNTDWQKISIFHTFNSQEQYYSMIHKYASTKRCNNTGFENKGQDLDCLEDQATL